MMIAFSKSLSLMQGSIYYTFYFQSLETCARKRELFLNKSSLHNSNVHIMCNPMAICDELFETINTEMVKLKFN
jgi:hypothetical protein